jgi:hypothetical protein
MLQKEVTSLKKILAEKDAIISQKEKIIKSYQRELIELDKKYRVKSYGKLHVSISKSLVILNLTQL